MVERFPPSLPKFLIFFFALIGFAVIVLVIIVFVTFKSAPPVLVASNLTQHTSPGPVAQPATPVSNFPPIISSTSVTSTYKGNNGSYQANSAPALDVNHSIDFPSENPSNTPGAETLAPLIPQKTPEMTASPGLNASNNPSAAAAPAIDTDQNAAANAPAFIP